MLSSVKIFTKPAPQRYAAKAEKKAAPAIPSEPAATSTFPKVPLLEFRSRLGIRKRSEGSRAKADGFLVPPASETAPVLGADPSSRTNPISATSRRPQNSLPGYSACPSFFSPKVTVASARTAAPMTAPVSELIPEGISTERTGAPISLIRLASSK